MKKLKLFILFVLIVCHCHSQHKIKINWNRPPVKKEVVQPIKVKQDTTVGLNFFNDLQLDNFIQTWLGVKYVFGGDSRRGIDCSAFVRRLYKSVYNKILPRTCVYQYKMVKKITKECLEIGDLVFFRVTGGSGWHVGVFIGEDKFVHASGRGRKVMVSSLNEEFYRNIYLGGGRL